MKKILLIAFLNIFIHPLYANSSLSHLSDANICSWFEIINTPQLYIDEAKKRSLKCSEPRVKFKIDCGSNHIQTINGCEKIPSNSRKFNSEWICELGFKKVNERCEVVILPENAFFTSLEDGGYACKVGYIKKSNICESRLPKIPKNAYIKGDSFACISGYYKNKKSCDRLPANAYSLATVEGFYCQNKYVKNARKDKCILKQIPITENKTSEIWNCGEGFKRVQNNCIKRTVYKDSPQFISGFFNSGKPTIYFWLALIFIAIALDNIFSLRRKRKENKEKLAEIHYQKLDKEKTKKSEALIEAKQKKEEAEVKKKKEEAKLKATELKRKKVEADAKRKMDEAKLRVAKIKRKKELAISKAAELKRKKEEIKSRLSEEKEKKEEDELRAAEIKQKEEEAKIKLDETKVKIEKTANFKDLYFDQKSDEWMELIKNSIDESDAPIILDLDATVSIDDLLFAKRRKDQKKYRSKILHQLSLKPKARFAYINETKLELEPMCIRHNKFPWLIASLDGVSSDFESIVEFDSSASSYWKAKNNKISDISYAKLQHLLMVSGSNTIDYWCYWPSKEGILQKVVRDDMYIDSLFKSQLEFVDNLINEND